MECVGCANRSCYDLTQHSKATKMDMSAKEDLAQPVSYHNVACPTNNVVFPTNNVVYHVAVLAILTSLTPPTLAYGGGS